MTPDDLDDEELLYIVGTTDKELFEAGADIKRRYLEVPQTIMRRFGYVSYTMAGRGKPQILDRIEAIFASIYRKQDVAMGGHIGVFMYRDIFAKIKVPHIYGRVKIKPFDFVELTSVQLRIIQTEQDQIETYVDQFYDVADIQYGIQELIKPFNEIELVVRFIDLARLHLHAASAVLTGGYDYRGAVQSSILATELALKAAAAAQGLTEDEIRQRFGHNASGIARFVRESWQSFDLDRVERVISTHPPYVKNRYSAEQPERRTVGHLVMGAQYLVSEVVRHLSSRNFRESMKSPMKRRYPA